MSVAKPTLTYFNGPGRAEVPRLLLELAGVDYEWVGFAYKGSPGPDWAEYKSKHGEELAFGQVPRYQEPEGLDLVQSNAISRHLANKHGFNGTNETEAALIDQFSEGVGEFATAGLKVIFAPEGANKAELLAKFLSEDLPKWLGHFDRALAKNGTGFFVGDKVSYADVGLFVTFNFVFKLLEGAREVFEGFSQVKAAYEKVASLPKIKAFYDSKPYGN